MVAFGMDLSLLTVVAVFLLEVLLLPSQFPHELQETRNLIQGLTFIEQIQAANTLSQETIKMAVFSYNVFLLCFWAYFFFSELWMAGSTLGKKTFGLTIMSLNTGEKPSVFESSFRAISKALALTVFVPFLLGLNYLAPYFNASRRAGHDFICKTIVVQATRPAPQGDV